MKKLLMVSLALIAAPILAQAQPARPNANQDLGERLPQEGAVVETDDGEGLSGSVSFEGKL